jgi:oxygen-dependent protoporphyrinogen oxidase
VIAVPAPVMLDLFPQLDDESRSLIERIEYNASISVSLGLARAPDERAAVLIVPRREQPDVLVIVLEHNKAPGRAPGGKGLVTFDWQGPWSAEHWEDPDDRITELTLAALDRAVPRLIDRQAIELAHVTRWRHCLMRGRPGHTRALARIRDARAASGSRVQLAGDYLGLSATGAAMCTGETAAERLIATHQGGHRRAAVHT